MITLKWHGEKPSLDSDQLELTVLKDISDQLNGLECPSDLICHTVFLEKSYDGPSVVVWGEVGDNDHFHCEYVAETEWVTLDTVEE